MSDVLTMVCSLQVSTLHSWCWSYKPVCVLGIIWADCSRICKHNRLAYSLQSTDTHRHHHHKQWMAGSAHSSSLLLTAGQTQLEAGCVLSVFPDCPGLAWPGSMWWHSQTWLSCPDWQSCGAAWPAGVRSLSPPPVTLDWLDSPGWPGWPGWPAPEISRQILSRSLLSLSHHQYWPPPESRGQLCRLGDPGGGGAEWDRGVGSQDVVQSVSRAACSSRLQEGQGTS